MQAVDYKYAQRQFLYRDEPQCFRSLPATTRSLGEYFRKFVDADDGWLQLRGLAPAIAVRRAGFGYLSRGDFRNIKRAVAELLDVGYFALGELDEDGHFLPLGSGDYLAIRDWVPSQRGMSRHETAGYYADQEERAARYLARLQADALEEVGAGSALVAGSDAAPAGAPAGANDEPRAEDVASTSPAPRTVATPKRTRKRPTVHRECIDKSASAGNSTGTDLAVFHTIPFRKPPISPKGEREPVFDSDSSPSPSGILATQAIEWLNQQRTPPTRFRADNPEMQRRARRWLTAGWDWQLLRKALDLRLASLKAANPDTWENWATPARLFGRRLRHYVDEARAGHSYCQPPTPRDQAFGAKYSPPCAPPSGPPRYHRVTERADADRRESAKRAFTDVLTVADMVGADGDWKSKLRHQTARRVIQAIGWKHIVEQREAIRDKFLGRYLGGAGHAIANAAA